MAFLGVNTAEGTIPTAAAWSSGTTYTPGQVVYTTSTPTAVTSAISAVGSYVLNFAKVPSTFTVGAVLSGTNVPTGATIVSTTGTTVTMSLPVATQISSSVTITATSTSYWVARLVKTTNYDPKSSNVGTVTTGDNTAKTPFIGSEFWSTYFGPYWVAAGSNTALITQSLPTYTHDKISGSVFSDVSGNLYIEQSGDNVTWDVINYTNIPSSGVYTAANTNAAIAITAGTPKAFSEEIVHPYYRLRYVATGSTAPATFRLFSRPTDASVKA
jgi:hypothetical protein